jgi:hypothetical protein
MNEKTLAIVYNNREYLNVNLELRTVKIFHVCLVKTQRIALYKGNISIL